MSLSEYLLKLKYIWNLKKCHYINNSSSLLVTICFTLKWILVSALPAFQKFTSNAKVEGARMIQGHITVILCGPSGHVICHCSGSLDECGTYCGLTFSSILNHPACVSSQCHSSERHATRSGHEELFCKTAYDQSPGVLWNSRWQGKI